MYAIPNITWIEAAMIRPGQKQLTMNPPSSEIASTVLLNARELLVAYSDGTSRIYSPHEDLPIIDA